MKRKIKNNQTSDFDYAVILEAYKLFGTYKYTARALGIHPDKVSAIVNQYDSGERNINLQNIMVEGFLIKGKDET